MKKLIVFLALIQGCVYTTVSRIDRHTLYIVAESDIDGKERLMKHIKHQHASGRIKCKQLRVHEVSDSRLTAYCHEWP